LAEVRFPPRTGSGGVIFMRTFFGMILGALILVGVVFVADTWSTGPAATTGSSPVTAHRTMVNWDVVGENLHILGVRARETWMALTRKITS
jgi:hypothetical protein